MNNNFHQSMKSLIAMATATIILAGCADDPAPVNQEELITTVVVELTPLTPGLAPITLRYYDADGIGSIAPEKSVSGPLKADTEYSGTITFKDETQTPADDVTTEIHDEANDHLVCYIISGADVTIEPIDSDGNARPIGLSTFWNTNTASNGNVQITLRHQPGVKTGTCPGPGETDVQVDFDIAIQ